MKFQKTLVAVAIAGIAAVPMVASADTTLSGVVQIQANGDDGDDDSSDITINADDVLFGITSEHELNSGLTGYSSVRVDINRLSNENVVTISDTIGNDDDDTPITEDTDVPTLGTPDSIYVGVKGGFGDLRFGEVANGIEVAQKANDIFDVTGEVNGGIGYSGTFGPVGLVLDFSPENNSDGVGVGLTFGLGGFSIGLGAEDKGGTEAAAIGAGFTFGGVGLNAHFWTRDDGGADDTEVASLLASFDFAGASATLTFSNQTIGDEDTTAIRLDAVYDLGGGMDISTRITSVEGDDESVDNVSYRLKLSKAF